ncbi:MAG: DUF1684 domain-containing protein [Ignavibacteria bacterium]|nr:DUF1684 domain-containing protein [Ignavibacteria bacterium]
MRVYFLYLVLALIFISCSNKKINPEYLKEIEEYRARKDSSFRYDPNSPFNRDKSVKFTGLKYFEVNPDFVFKSKLYRYALPETVIVLGTKGEERTQIKYGYFQFQYKGKTHKINVYKYPESSIKEGKEYLKNYLAVWFRDLTTGEETYDVGRYLDVEEENPDPDYLYTLDFNKAYNPYCAYTPIYSCAIPREEDFIQIRIEAGEKKYHNK